MSTSRRMWSLDDTVGGIGGLEKIKDQQGNNRFISGDIIQRAEIQLPEGMTVKYSKWILSGNHLMFVIAGSFDKNIESYTQTNYPWYVMLPDFIMNKIIPLTEHGAFAAGTIKYIDDYAYTAGDIGTICCSKKDTYIDIGFGRSLSNVDIGAFRTTIDFAII